MGFIEQGRPYGNKRRLYNQKQRSKLRKTEPAVIKPKLTNLPTELLFNIFCHVPVNDNHLPHTCKYLHEMLRVINVGPHFIQKLIWEQFAMDLNQDNHLLPTLENLVHKVPRSSQLNQQVTQSVDRLTNSRFCLNPSIFTHPFAYSIDPEFYDQFTLISHKSFQREKIYRLKYTTFMIAYLEQVLQNPPREYEQMDIDDDNEEYQQFHQKLMKDEDVSSYLQGPFIPYVLSSSRAIEGVYPVINTQEKFTKIKYLIDKLNFTFQNVSRSMINVMDSSIEFREKRRMLEFAYKEVMEQDSKTITIPFVIRLLACLSDSKYNSKLEVLCHKVLRDFYRYNLEEQGESFDGEIWEFVKNCKETEMFQILCGYSNPTYLL